MGFQKTFNGKIEALRGIAALVVAFAHSTAVLQLDHLPAYWAVPFQSLPGWGSRTAKLLIVPFNAGNAVILFFTMSGYVLCLSLARGAEDAKATLHFYLRRVFRIYPAFLVSLVVFFLVRHTFHPDLNPALFSDWAVQTLGRPVDYRQFFQDLTLCRFNISIATWTLNVEMAAALFLPALFFIVRKRDMLTDAAVLAGLLWISWQLQDYNAARFLFSFHLGMLIAANQDRIPATLQRPGAHRFLLGAAMAALLVASPMFTGLAFTRDLLGAVGCGLLILAVSGPAGHLSMTWLDGRFCHTLGRISYSFYLLHPLALFLVCWTLKFIPEKMLRAPPALIVNVACFAISSTIAFGMALLSHRYIELPMIERSRLLSKAHPAPIGPGSGPRPFQTVP